MFPVVLAASVAITHLALIAFLLAGGLLAWRWRRLLWVHVPFLLAILTINLLGADCPLTNLELALLQAGGAQPYDGGFIEHYLVEPVYPDGITPRVRMAIYAVAGVPNAVAYAGLLARTLRRRSAAVAPQVA